MSTIVAAPATLTYRPLDPALGDAEALAELRALRAERRAADEHQLDLARAADRRERAERAARKQARRSAKSGHRGQGGHRGHRGGGLWGLLAA